MSNNPLYVASPLLPQKEELFEMISDIFDSKYVTNHGPYHNELELKLQDVLDVPTAKLFNNGTIALLTALKMFDFPPGSEVITTPFTFAATAHAISWNNLVPVFADIDEETLTIDPDAIELAITEKTVAILAVHVYGNVCNLERISEIAEEYNLKVIYDAAHAFDVKVNGKGIGNYGDASAFSFHATKLYNTIEGGALVTPKESDAEKIYMLRNFGIKNEDEVIDIGINGKMNEIQAAIGLLNLKEYEKEKQFRSELRKKYNDIFSGIPGISTQKTPENITPSEQYYPLLFNDSCPLSRDELYEKLKEENIFTRKYFNPICTDYTPYKDFKIFSKHEEPIAEKIKNNVLCLPFHSDVKDSHLTNITEAIKV